MGLSWTLVRNTHIDFSDALHIPYGGITLISPLSNKRVLDMWVFVGVFGLVQWLLFASLLGITFLVLLTIGQNEEIDNTGWSIRLYTTFC